MNYYCLYKAYALVALSSCLFVLLPSCVMAGDIISTKGVDSNDAPPAVKFLASNWEATNFLTLEIPTRAIAFDLNYDLYIENTDNDGSGEVEILKLTASSGYNESVRYASYKTDYRGVRGLSFDNLGSLYVAERSADGNAGIIREIDAVEKTLKRDLVINDHRPTGVGTDTSSNIFYSGRRRLDGTWGKIFKIDTNSVPTDLIDRVATGIAVNSSGEIFISTPARDDLPLLSNSIYRFAVNDLLNPELIATFDATGGELTFDAEDNLYVVADDEVSIIKLSIRPRSMPWLPLLLE